MLVRDYGFSASVAAIVGSRHRHGPNVAHSTGGLSRTLRPTSDVSAAAQDLADLYLQGGPEAETTLTAHAMWRLFDDPTVYGTHGPELASNLSERFGLPTVGADSTKLPTLGVGVMETSRGMLRVAIRPDTGDPGIMLPFHGDHFGRLTGAQEAVFSTIVTRAIGTNS